MFLDQIVLNVSKKKQKNNGRIEGTSRRARAHHLRKWHAHMRARNAKSQKLSSTKQPCKRASTQMGGEIGAHMVPDLSVRRIQSPVWRPGGEYIDAEGVGCSGV